MKLPCYLILIVFITALYISCGNISSDSTGSGNGSIEIISWINKLQANNTIRATTWSNMVVRISADDMGTIHDTFDVTMDNSFYTFTIENVPDGDNRLVELWTIDDEYDMIHGIDSATVVVEAAKTTQIVSELHPIRGSIYIALTEIPTIVDSVEFTFASIDTSWQVKAAREPKLTMSLDKIPFGTTGTLSIIGYNTTNDTVASWVKDNFTFTNSNITIEASFISVGKIAIQVTIFLPGVTVIFGIMDTTDSIEDEKGGLIISEIMYSANDSEYVELYNPKNTAFNDTIILQKDNGTFRYFYVVIPPQSFFVIGRRCDTIDSLNPWWYDTLHSTKSALDLSSTSGNWITVRRASDSSIIDNVAFQTGSNEQEWPNFSSSTKASIVLDSLPDDPEYNNYGRNWIQAKTYIDTTITKQIGTPGEAGS